MSTMSRGCQTLLLGAKLVKNNPYHIFSPGGSLRVTPFFVATFLDARRLELDEDECNNLKFPDSM